MHFLGSRLRLTLSVILPYEARTFLTVIPFGNIPRDRLAEPLIIIHYVGRFVKGKGRKVQNAECRVKASPVGGDIPGDPKTNEYRAQKKKLKKIIFFYFST